MAVAQSTLNFLRQPVRRGVIPALNRSKPQILWIGCSSSGVQEPQVLGVPPEEIIVHRNIGNLLSNNDLSSLSSLEYAVKIAKVQHIIVCGHYGCKFVSADQHNRTLSTWLNTVGQLYDHHRVQLDAIETDAARDERFAELHALDQARSIMQRDNVRRAIEERDLKVHAFMYDPEKEECVELKAQS